jgi:hypothetical protein
MEAPNMKAVRILSVPLAALVVCLASGCGGGLSKANFESVKDDGSQSLADVEKALGAKPTEVTGDEAKAVVKGVAKLAGDATKKAAEAVGVDDPGKKLIGAGLDALAAAADLAPKVYRFGDESKNIVVVVVDGKVVGKASKGL